MILQVVGSYRYCCVDAHVVPIDVSQVQVFFVVIGNEPIATHLMVLPHVLV
jgi:hypothetical protein